MKAKRAKRRKLTPEEKLERARAKTTAAMVEAAPSAEGAKKGRADLVVLGAPPR